MDKEKALDCCLKQYRFLIAAGFPHEVALNRIKAPAKSTKEYRKHFGKCLNALAWNTKLENYWSDYHAGFRLISPRSEKFNWREKKRNGKETERGKK